MTTEQDLVAHLWRHLKSDRTVMLSLDRALDDHPRPMTVLVREGDDATGPLWIFTATDTSLVKALDAQGRGKAVATFAAKGHDLFATIRGALVRSDDRAVIDELWNPFVAAWYEGGKDDPKLVLLRFDPAEATIWENETSLFAGLKLLLGADPKDSYKDKVARVAL